MNELEDSFHKLLGRQPSDRERQQLYKVRDALELKNNDALWLVLLALQHHQTMYEAHPQLIKQAAQEILASFRQTAEATIAASSAAAKADLAHAIAATARDVARLTAAKDAARWIATCALLSCLAVGTLGWVVHNGAYRAGYDSGYGKAYAEAKDEKAAAAWANTPQGKSAYRLAQTTAIDALIKCEQPGWKVQDGACFVSPAPDGNTYGWRVR